MSPLSLNNSTERQLISLCKEGDRVACKQLFDMYSGKMMALCYRFARDRNEAEDILQEGFVRVFTKLHLYGEKGSFEAWMKRVIINTAIKYREKNIKKHSYSEIDEVHVFDPTPDIIQELSKEEIMNVIQELPDGYRTVFNLFVIEGYSHKDIGQMLKIGESTSRSQLVKARNLLKKKLINEIKLAG